MYKVYVIDTPIYSDDEHFFQSSQACTNITKSVHFCDPLNETLYTYMFGDVQRINAKIIINVPTTIKLTIYPLKIRSKYEFNVGQIRSINTKRFEIQIDKIKINGYTHEKNEINIDMGIENEPITIIINPEKNITIPENQNTLTISSLTIIFQSEEIKLTNIEAVMSFTKGYIQIKPSEDITGVKGKIICKADEVCDLTVDEISGIDTDIKKMDEGESYDFYYFTKEKKLMNIDKVYSFIIFDMYCRFKVDTAAVNGSKQLTPLQKKAAANTNLYGMNSYRIFEQFLQKCKQDYLFSKALASNYVYDQSLKLDYYSMYVYLFIKMKQDSDITDIINKINDNVNKEFRESFEKNYLEKICEPNNMDEVEKNIKDPFLSDIRKCQYALINTEFNKNKINQDNLNKLILTYDNLFSQSVSARDIKSIQDYVKGLDVNQKKAFNKNIITVIDKWIYFIMETHNRNIISIFPGFINYYLYMDDIEERYDNEIQTLKKKPGDISKDIENLGTDQITYTEFLEKYNSLDILIYKKIMDRLNNNFKPDYDRPKKMLLALLRRIYEPFEITDPSEIKNENIKQAYGCLNNLNCIYYTIKKNINIENERIKTYTIFDRKIDIVLD